LTSTPSTASRSPPLARHPDERALEGAGRDRCFDGFFLFPVSCRQAKAKASKKQPAEKPAVAASATDKKRGSMVSAPLRTTPGGK
jgi:hypothetical protein